jgi:large subunit ribosomal protein L24
MSSKHVRKGDVVMVTSGDFKGQTGEVIRVIPKHDHVIVKGINMVTRNIKATKAQPQGSQVSREAPLHISKVSPVVDGKPTRVRFSTKADGTKVRVAVRGAKELSVIRKARTGKTVKTAKPAKK